MVAKEGNHVIPEFLPGLVIMENGKTPKKFRAAGAAAGGDSRFFGAVKISISNRFRKIQ